MSECSHGVTLRIGGVDYTRWKRVRVHRSMDELCGTFRFESSADSEFDRTTWPFAPGTECEVMAGDVVVCAGYIEEFKPAYDADGHSVRIGGREKTCDLVDCTRQSNTMSWRNDSVQDIIAKLISPHNLDLVIDATVADKAAEKEDWFSYGQGDKLLDTIIRLTSGRGILVLTSSEGELVLTRAGSMHTSDSLRSGVNVLSAALRSSDKERFSNYFTKGIGFGTDRKTTKDYVQPEGEAADSGVQRYRPLTIINDAATSSGGCGDRARWEAALRAGNSRVYDYTVQGWLQSDGQLWAVNTLVKVKDTVLGIDTELLIFSVDFSSEGGRGTIATLHLCSAEKYKAEPELEKVSSSFDFL